MKVARSAVKSATSMVEESSAAKMRVPKPNKQEETSYELQIGDEGGVGAGERNTEIGEVADDLSRFCIFPWPVCVEPPSHHQARQQGRQKGESAGDAQPNASQALNWSLIRLWHWSSIAGDWGLGAGGWGKHCGILDVKK